MTASKPKRGALIAVGVALVAIAAQVDPRSHFPASVIALGLLHALDRPLAARVGRPWQWAIALAVLAVFGAWLGARDATLFGVGYSMAGVFQATTMIARSLGLVIVTSSVMASLPRERVLAALARTPLRRVAEVSVVALALVPAVLAGLRERTRTLRSDGKGKRLGRLHAVAIAVVSSASDTALETARDFARARSDRPDAPQ